MLPLLYLITFIKNDSLSFKFICIITDVSIDFSNLHNILNLCIFIAVKDIKLLCLNFNIVFMEETYNDMFPFNFYFQRNNQSIPNDLSCSHYCK